MTVKLTPKQVESVLELEKMLVHGAELGKGERLALEQLAKRSRRIAFTYARWAFVTTSLERRVAKGLIKESYAAGLIRRELKAAKTELRALAAEKNASKELKASLEKATKELEEEAARLRSARPPSSGTTKAAEKAAAKTKSLVPAASSDALRATLRSWRLEFAVLLENTLDEPAWREFAAYLESLPPASTRGEAINRINRAHGRLTELVAYATEGVENQFGAAVGRASRKMEAWGVAGEPLVQRGPSLLVGSDGLPREVLDGSVGAVRRAPTPDVPGELALEMRLQVKQESDWAMEAMGRQIGINDPRRLAAAAEGHELLVTADGQMSRIVPTRRPSASVVAQPLLYSGPIPSGPRTISVVLPIDSQSLREGVTALLRAHGKIP